MITKRDVCLFCFGLTSCLVVFLVHSHRRADLRLPPPVTGDHIEYDNLAWEWSTTGRFQRHWDSPSFRAPYEEAGLDLPIGDAQITAGRPPLFVLILAAGNRMFGRQFWFGRVVNTLAMAIVCGLAAVASARLADHIMLTGITETQSFAKQFPWVVSIVAVAQFILVDVRTRTYARELLTESLSALAVSTMLIVMWLAVPTGATKIASRPKKGLFGPLVLGITVGVAMLLRTAFAIWIPVMGLALLAWHGRLSRARGIVAALIFVAASALVFSPWAIRNCQVTSQFRPLGTQGATQAAAAYNDESIGRMGLWMNLEPRGFFDSVDQRTNGMENELARADASTAAARAWVRSHWYQLIVLMPLRVVSEWRPWNLCDLYLLAMSVLGWLAIRRHPFAVASAVLALACSVGIAVTWSVAGRFIVPLLFPLHVFAAIGVVTTTRSAYRQGTRGSQPEA
ncbi:MAG: hypothetical protein AAGA03_01530 [Planctomycetota bacterium]